MKVTILGATKGIGRALARQFAQRGERLFLLGRERADLERTARDLEIRGAAAPVQTALCDLLRPETFSNALDLAAEGLGGLETIVITAGLFGMQAELEADPRRLADLLAADFANTILFCEEARRRLLARGGGTLCVFSSVAGERGRKPVVLYGAAKAGLSCYLEGLDHKYRAAGLRTVCVKPGFVRTGMTWGLKPPPFAAAADVVARRVLRAIDRGWPEVYVPAVWRPIMALIRCLPRWVMRRIEF